MENMIRSHKGDIVWDWDVTTHCATSGPDHSVGPFTDNSGSTGLGSCVDQAAAAILALGVEDFVLSGGCFVGSYRGGKHEVSYCR